MVFGGGADLTEGNLKQQRVMQGKHTGQRRGARALGLAIALVSWSLHVRGHERAGPCSDRRPEPRTAA